MSICLAVLKQFDGKFDNLPCDVLTTAIQSSSNGAVTESHDACDTKAAALNTVFALQHFEGYDPEGFSMWLCDYKYNDENTVNYVVMNKVSFLKCL